MRLECIVPSNAMASLFAEVPLERALIRINVKM